MLKNDKAVIVQLQDRRTKGPSGVDMADFVDDWVENGRN
jgi:hypothetical protein